MKRILPILLLVMVQGLLYAQDPHFSQYFASPLTQNPANTGSFEGEHRIATNFRQQSLGSGNLFRTATVSWDTKLLTASDERSNWAVGLLALTDQSSAGAYRSNFLSLSTAYHITLDENEEQQLGLGFQATYANRYIDFNKLSFASQFTSGGFDMAIPSGEVPANAAIHYFDFNFGALYTYRNDIVNAYLGASVYHLTKPRQSFYEDQLNRLALRSAVHAGIGLRNGDQQFQLSGMYMHQGPASVLSLGATYGYPLGMEDEDRTLFAGAWYRWKDAVYPYIGLQWDNVQAGISYDVYTASWNGGNGALKSRSVELSLIYHFRSNPDARYLVSSRY